MVLDNIVLCASIYQFSCSCLLMVEFLLLLLFYLDSFAERIQECEYLSPKTVKFKVIYTNFRANFETFLVMPCIMYYFELQKSC